MIGGKERHHAAPKRRNDEDDDNHDTFTLVSLATDRAMVAIVAKREWYKLGDVMRGRRKAYLRGAEPKGEVVVMRPLERDRR